MNFKRNLSPSKIEKIHFVSRFCSFRFRGPILAILKLFPLKSIFFKMKFNADLSPCKIEKITFFRGLLDLDASLKLE